MGSFSSIQSKLTLSETFKIPLLVEQVIILSFQEAGIAAFSILL